MGFIWIYTYWDFVATLTSDINRLGILRIWSDVVELSNTPVRWTVSQSAPVLHGVFSFSPEKQVDPFAMLSIFQVLLPEMMSFQPPLFLNQWSSLQKTSMGSWKGSSWTGVSQALCALPLAAMGYVGVAQWMFGALHVFVSKGHVEKLGVTKLAEWALKDLFATGVFQNSNDAGAERCCFQKHPKLTTLRKIKLLLQLGTWTLWRKSLKSSIHNNKSCVWKKRAMNFFLRARTGRFPKKLGGCFFMAPHL